MCRKNDDIQDFYIKSTIRIRKDINFISSRQILQYKISKMCYFRKLFFGLSNV